VDTTNTSLTGSITLTGAAPDAGVYVANSTVNQDEADFGPFFLGGIKLHFNPGIFGPTLITLSRIEVDSLADLNDGTDTTAVAIAISSAVPEASTWIMMIFGFCGLGFIASRQRNRQMAAA
jgi:hypothetical protein